MIQSNRKSIIIKRRELIYYFCYIIYLTYTLLGASFFVKYYISIYTYGVAAILVPLLASEMAYGKYRKKAIILMIPCIIVLLIIMRVSDNSKTINILALILFIYGARNMSFERIAKITVLIDFLILFLVIISSKLGIIQNYISYSFGRQREYLGFLYALTPLSIFANAVLLETYINRKKIPIYRIGLYGLIAFALFRATNSRLNFIITIIALFVSLFDRIIKNDKLIGNIISKVFMCVSFPVCAVISVYLSYTYTGTGWTAVLNSLLGSRIRLAHNALMQYGITLFGNEIEWSGWGLNSLGEVSSIEYNYVDNSYVQMLVQYGIIVFVLVLLFFSLLQVFLCRKNEYFLSMILTIIAFHGLIDDSIFGLAYNTFWLAFSLVISKEYKTFKVLRKSKRSKVLLAS